MNWRIHAVSVIGILGLTLAFAYIFAVYLAFQPGFADLTYLFVGRSDRELPLFVLTALAPYSLLMAHLYFRTKLGGVLLKTGAVADAIAYTSPKLHSSLLRSGTEAAFHRLFLAQAYVRELRYEEALKTLDDVKTVPRRLKDEYLRWKLEILLRRENLKRAQALIPELRKSKGEATGCAWAAVAELATRQNDRPLFDQAWQNATWALPVSHPRLAFSAQCASARFGLPSVSDEATGFLTQVPGAALEWAVLQGNTNPQPLADSRSEWVAQQRNQADDNSSK